MTTRPAIARLKVTLEDVEPRVMRRLDVPLKIRLDRLHLVLQAAMGWTNSHLYEFRASGSGWRPNACTATTRQCPCWPRSRPTRAGSGYTSATTAPSPAVHRRRPFSSSPGIGVSPIPTFDDGPLPAAKATLFDVIEDTGARTIHYLYDFGDGWDHAVRIERIGEPDPQALYPQLVAATGRCPPEDVGGPWGYAEFLAAIADPAHEDHDHMLSWCGGAFDPDSPDIEQIVLELERLARRWAPRPRKTKTTSSRS